MSEVEQHCEDFPPLYYFIIRNFKTFTERKAVIQVNNYLNAQNAIIHVFPEGTAQNIHTLTVTQDP